VGKVGRRRRDKLSERKGKRVGGGEANVVGDENRERGVGEGMRRKE